MFSSAKALGIYFVGILLPLPVLQAQYPGPAEVGAPGMSLPAGDPRLADSPMASPRVNEPWSFDAAYPAVDARSDAFGSVSVSELKHPLSGKAQSLLLKAKTDLHEGKFDDAMSVLESAEKQPSATVYIPGLRGAAYLLRGNVDDALPQLENAVKLLPVAANYSNLGFAHLLKGDVDQAEQELRHALNLRNSPATRYLMGLILLDRKPSVDEACDDLQQGQNVTGAAPIALAVCFARDGHPSAANRVVEDYFGPQQDSEVEYWEAWVANVAKKAHPSAEFGLHLGEQP